MVRSIIQEKTDGKKSNGCYFIYLLTKQDLLGILFSIKGHRSASFMVEAVQCTLYKD